MSSLTRCLLCRVPLCDGKEWDGGEHVCETEIAREVRIESATGSAEVGLTPEEETDLYEWYKATCGDKVGYTAGYAIAAMTPEQKAEIYETPPDPPSELPTEPELPSDADLAQSEREGRAEYESELDEAIEDWLGI